MLKYKYTINIHTMDYTLFWTQFFAIYMVVMGIALFGRKDDMLKMMRDFKNSPGLIMIASIFTLMLGSTIVLTHNVWTGGLAVVVTVIGWITLLKGVLYAIAPNALIKMGASMMRGSGMSAWSLITLVVGLILGYYGFIVG